MRLEGTRRFPDTRNQRMALNHGKTALVGRGLKVHSTLTNCMFLRERRIVGRGRIC